MTLSFWSFSLHSPSAETTIVSHHAWLMVSEIQWRASHMLDQWDTKWATPPAILLDYWQSFLTFWQRGGGINKLTRCQRKCNRLMTQTINSLPDLHQILDMNYNNAWFPPLSLKSHLFGKILFLLLCLLAWKAYRYRMKHLNENSMNQATYWLNDAFICPNWKVPWEAQLGGGCAHSLAETGKPFKHAADHSAWVPLMS